MSKEKVVETIEEVTAGGSLGELIADTLYERAAGICIGTPIREGEPHHKCGREFISKERYDEVIRPRISELVTSSECARVMQSEVERLQRELAEANRKLAEAKRKLSLYTDMVEYSPRPKEE